MSEKQLREDMVRYARSMFERGYSSGGAGNISLKLPDGNILATPITPALATSMQTS